MVGFPESKTSIRATKVDANITSSTALNAYALTKPSPPSALFMTGT